MSSTEIQAAPLAPEKVDQWFSNLIDTIRVDHLQLETDVASHQKKNMYSMLINGDTDVIMASTRKEMGKYFIRKTVVNYVQELLKNEVKFHHLAFDLSRSTILVWAQVADDDEDTIDQLIMAEAQANADSYDSEFHISTTVVEERDHIATPSQYRPLNFSRD